MLSSRYFVVLGFVFKLTNFKVIFVNDVRYGSKFHSFASEYSVFPAPFIEDYLFSVSFSQDQLTVYRGCISGAASILFHWFMCLFLYKYHTFDYYSFTNIVGSQKVWCLQLHCFLVLLLAIWGIFVTSFRIICPTLIKKMLLHSVSKNQIAQKIVKWPEWTFSQRYSNGQQIHQKGAQHYESWR